ncbi:MAG: phosphoribosylformylglycinamidine synthase subunit PurQ [Microscillaceae bacterium]|jgi:phosphoribosylformylglycinamidine synthase|nr:phosphoribosylformylglycinamidine synthase subunit PurQ [Microscillaceae bacterium]
MKFGVVVFPGSNCDDDMVYVLREIMHQAVIKIWHKDTDLQNCDFVVVPGGFSYGDYLRSGAIARFSPIMDSIIQHARRGGYVFGICNGFQILTEAHLLEGALLKNENQKYNCKNIYLKPQTQDSLLTGEMDLNTAYKIPIAHGDGRYYVDADTLKKLNDNQQVIFRYCNEQGEINDSANPNGSIENIAGVCNLTRNVFGMMPHPERATDPLCGNTAGRKLFESILAKVLV